MYWPLILKRRKIESVERIKKVEEVEIVEMVEKVGDPIIFRLKDVFFSFLDMGLPLIYEERIASNRKKTIRVGRE